MTEHSASSVISKDGVRGSFVEGMPTGAASKDVLIRFENGQQVLIPIDSLTAQADGRYYYLPLRLDELAQQSGMQPADQPYVLPVVEEVLDITRQRQEIGRVRIEKHVHERTEVVDQPLLRDSVTVTRVPINRVIDQPIDARQEGETLIVPVLEEVLVVEKRLLLVEEVHVTRHTSETHQPQQVTLRREEVTVQRLTPRERVESDGTESAD